MSWLSYQQQVQDRSPWFPLDTNKDPRCRTQPAAITLSPAEAALIYFHKFAMLPPPTTIKKKQQWTTQNEVRHYLAAELRPVSDSLVVNTEFHTTLKGQRMAPYLEQERGQ